MSLNHSNHKKDQSDGNHILPHKKDALKRNIVEYLFREGIKSNSEICHWTNMTAPSINKILNELISEDIIEDKGVGKSIGGRRPNMYGLNPDSKFIIGLDIKRDVTQIAIFNFDNENISSTIEHKIKIANDLNFVNKIVSLIKKQIDQIKIKKEKIIGLGVSLPGLVNSKLGISYGYLNFDSNGIQALFEKKLDIPVFIENDSRLMAMGEHVYGLAKGRENVMCINILAGVGMGMILNGKLYQGKSGFAGEFGHIQTVENGELCYCGKRGCLETVASGKTLKDLAIKGIQDGVLTKINEKISDLAELEAETVIKAAKEGDQFAISILAEIGEQLGKGISTLLHIFNPEMVIIGGKVASAGEYIIDPINQALNKHTMLSIKQDTELVASQLGKEACIKGAIALAINKAFELNINII